LPQSLDVLDPNRHKLIGLLPVVLTLDDDILDEIKESFEYLAVIVAASENILVNIFGHLVLFEQDLELMLDLIVVMLDVTDKDVD
jgi:hypothetical protein